MTREARPATSNGRASERSLTMSNEDARLLQEMIGDYCGLSYGLDSVFMLERRVEPRLRALGMTSYRDYYHYLRYDQEGRDELERLVESLTTHETYLFREQYQLDAFSEQIIPEVALRNKKSQRFSVWSAGCSTGEEAYTIAILMHESSLLRDWSVRVIGTDISRRVIKKARRGVYGSSSFRTTSPEVIEKYFQSHQEQLMINDDIRARCSFGHLNLLTVERFHAIGECDVIFCRNVLMYLSRSARERIVQAFYNSLRPGGFLLLGHSESLLNITSQFDIVHLARDLVYQRPY